VVGAAVVFVVLVLPEVVAVVLAGVAAPAAGFVVPEVVVEPLVAGLPVTGAPVEVPEPVAVVPDVVAAGAELPVIVELPLTPVAPGLFWVVSLQCL
jgi:hypothetical protein